MSQLLHDDSSGETLTCFHGLSSVKTGNQLLDIFIVVLSLLLVL